MRLFTGGKILKIVAAPVGLFVWSTSPSPMGLGIGSQGHIERLPVIRRGKPFSPYKPELNDVPSSATDEPEVSPNPDRT